MNLHASYRRCLLMLAALVLTVTVSAADAADAFPSRPVTLIVNGCPNATRSLSASGRAKLSGRLPGPPLPMRVTGREGNASAASA
ncbi:MAG: hypothetical protein EOO29_14205, partial [Comamonadaceae bacterium]